MLIECQALTYGLWPVCMALANVIAIARSFFAPAYHLFILACLYCTHVYSTQGLALGETAADVLHWRRPPPGERGGGSSM